MKTATLLATALTLRSVAMLVVFTLVSCSQTASGIRPETAGAPQIVGTWRIVSIDTSTATGEPRKKWMGEKPDGVLMYDGNGSMSVQLVKDPRPRFAEGNHEKATTEEKVGAFDGYYAYFGRYEIDAASSTVTHFVRGSLLADEEVGVTYKRRFRLDGDRLELTTAPFAEGGEQRVNRLVWERVR
jgi:Lipocalin-like domain